jgi:hypothetical protein
MVSVCVGGGGQALINHGALNSSSIRDTFGRDFYLLKEVIAPHGNVIEYALQGTREVCVWRAGGGVGGQNQSCGRALGS